MLGEQHAVAEHVAGHVTYPHAGEVGGLAVDADLAEVTLDRFPGAARRDAHLLVVITDRAAGGERITEPVAILLAYLVGDVGEGGGALVGGHDQVVVILVVTHHGFGRDHLPLDDVVGDIEQAADEEAIAGLALFLDDGAGRAHRHLLAIEAALGADRHDDGVLHLLRLDQTQHLGAEIFLAIGPAQAATGHLAPAQMHPFHPRRVDEDLEFRQRQRHVGDAGGGQLEGDVGLGLTLLIRLVVVGAQGGVDHLHVAADDAIVVQVRHLIQLGGELLVQLGLGLGILLARGVEALLEQGEQQLCDVGITGQGLLDIGLAEGDAGLAHVFRIGAQHRDLTTGEAGPQHQTVEAVIFQGLVPDGGEGLLEALLALGQIEWLIAAQQHGEVEDPEDLATRGAHLIGRLTDDAQPHVFQHGQDVGEVDGFGAVEQLETHPAIVLFFLGTVEQHAQRLGFTQAIEGHDVGHGRARQHVFLVSTREGSAETAAQFVASGFPIMGEQHGVQAVVPAAGRFNQVVLYFVHIHIHVVVVDPHYVVGPCQHAFGEVDVELHIKAAAKILLQNLLGLDPQRRVVALLGDIDHAGEETAVDIAAHEQAQHVALLHLQHPKTCGQQLLFPGLDQLVAGIGLQHVEQRLVGVGALLVTGGGHDALEAVADEGDLGGAGVVDGGGVETDEAIFPHHLAVFVEALDADVIHIGRTVYPGLGVGLGEDQQVRAQGRVTGAGGHAAQALAFVLDGVLHQAQAGFRLGQDLVIPLHRFHVITAIAHQGEVVGSHPFEEGDAGVHLGLADRVLALGQLLDDLVQATQHGLPIPDRQGHFPRHRVELGGQGIHLFLIRKMIDLDEEGGLDRGLGSRIVEIQDGAYLAFAAANEVQRLVQHHVGRDAPTLEGHADGIHQERGVLQDDLDDGMGRLPSVAGQLGVVDPDIGLCAGALVERIPQAQRRPVEIAVIAIVQVGARHVAVELGDEAFDQGGAVLGQFLMDQAENVFEQN
ncbi:hypothetical protein D3C79_312940 [compost metagenome]